MSSLRERFNRFYNRLLAAYKQTLSDQTALTNAIIVVVFLLFIGTLIFVAGAVLLFISYLFLLSLIGSTGFSIVLVVYVAVMLFLLVLVSIYQNGVCIVVANRRDSSNPPDLGFFLTLLSQKFDTYVNMFLFYVMLGVAALVLCAGLFVVASFVGVSVFPHLHSILLLLLISIFLYVVFFVILLFFFLFLANMTVIGLAGIFTRNWGVIEACRNAFSLTIRTFFSMTGVLTLTFIVQTLVGVVLSSINFIVGLVPFIGLLISFPLSILTSVVAAGVWAYCQISVYRYVIDNVLPLVDQK